MKDFWLKLLSVLVAAAIVGGVNYCAKLNDKIESITKDVAVIKAQIEWRSATAGK